MGDFSERVFSVVRQIPRGKVATYGQVGSMIGAPRSARYVGYALHGNPNPGSGPGCTPCHRVVFKDGSMATGFAFGGPDEQRKMLAAEGIAFDDEGRVLMEQFQWDGRGAADSEASGGTGDGTGANCEVRGNAGNEVHGEGCSEVHGEGRTAHADAPLGPPPDFDWKAELGE